MRARRVDALLMGGQACVLYGAAEFSRDVDFAITASTANLAGLQLALEDLSARRIAVPPFELRHLRRGHAIHFRCRDPEADGLRIDVMSRMRGVDAFPKLWKRRTTVELPEGAIEVMSIRDLVKAKKTQRDKDWPMIQRLMEASYFAGIGSPTPALVRFWLAELRTSELLIELAGARPDACRRAFGSRPLLRFAAARRTSQLADALQAEERREREADRRYWKPLKAELEAMRHRPRG